MCNKQWENLINIEHWMFLKDLQKTHQCHNGNVTDEVNAKESTSSESNMHNTVRHNSTRGPDPLYQLEIEKYEHKMFSLNICDCDQYARAAVLVKTGSEGEKVYCNSAPFHISLAKAREHQYLY